MLTQFEQQSSTYWVEKNQRQCGTIYFDFLSLIFGLQPELKQKARTMMNRNMLATLQITLTCYIIRMIPTTQQKNSVQMHVSLFSTLDVVLYSSNGTFGSYKSHPFKFQPNKICPIFTLEKLSLCKRKAACQTLSLKELVHLTKAYHQPLAR